MTYRPVSQVRVGLDFGSAGFPVGRLAIRDGRPYFEYDGSFLERALEISPLRLPLRPGLHSFDIATFEGLPGCFNDSLPDGWGRLLFERAMRTRGVPPQGLNPLDRLAHVGKHGMGALTYEPDLADGGTGNHVDLDRLAIQSGHVLEGHADDVIPELLALNGSSAGARPKILVGYDPSQERLLHGRSDPDGSFEHWMVKFASTQDGPDSGAIEFVYAEMARRAGLDVMETRLFPARKGAGYFATKRFDRNGCRRLHMHSASGLLHADFRTFSLDYEDLVRLNLLLVRDRHETGMMFRMATFNVLAHNRDDHSRNFSWLMNDRGEWSLSPAYDLTFSSGPGGEQSMTVMGEGKKPGIEDLRALGRMAEMDRRDVDHIIDQTLAALADWPSLARTHGVTPASIRLIAGHLSSGSASKGTGRPRRPP